MLAVDAIIAELKKLSKPVTTPEEIAQVRKKYTLKCIPSLGSCFSKSFVRSGLMKLCAPDTGAFLFTSEVVINCTARS